MGGWKRNRCFVAGLKTVLRYALVVAGISFAAALLCGASLEVVLLGVVVFLLVFVPAMLGVYSLWHLNPYGDLVFGWYRLSSGGVWLSKRPGDESLFVSPASVVSVFSEGPDRFVLVVEATGGEMKVVLCPEKKDVGSVKSLFGRFLG